MNMPTWISIPAFFLTLWLSGFGTAAFLSRVSPLTTFERVLFAFPLGAATIGLIEFCGNIFFKIPINSFFLYSIAILLAVPGLIALVIENRNKSKSIVDWINDSRSPWNWLVIFELSVLLFLLIRQILESWTRPIIFVDAMVQHLPFAKIIFQTGGLPQYADPHPYYTLFAISPLLFLINASGWIWLQEIHLLITSLTSLLFGIHICILIFHFAKHLLKVETYAALGAVLFVLLPSHSSMVTLLNWGTNIDIPYTFWAIAAVYFLSKVSTNIEPRSWVWCAICLAVGAWIKPFGFLFAAAVTAAGGITWVIDRATSQRTYINVKCIINIAALCNLILLPFYIRGWIFWGNPVYPFFSNIFGGYLVDVQNMMLELFFPKFNDFQYDYLLMMSRMFLFPAMGFVFPLLFVPRLFKHVAIRLIFIVIICYFTIYFMYWKAIPIIGIPDSGSYLRYLFPGLMLFGVCTSYMLDNKSYVFTSRMTIIFLAVLGIQIGTLIHSGSWTTFFTTPQTLNSYKVFAYDHIAFILAGSFLFSMIIYVFNKNISNAIRIVSLGASCLILVYPWPLSRPWESILDPLRHQTDWKATPVISPYGKWTHEKLPRSAVLLTGETRLWLVPRPIILPASPLLFSCYQPNVSIESKLRTLAETGITHLVLFGKDGVPSTFGPSATAFDPVAMGLFDQLRKSRRLKEVYKGNPVLFTQDPQGFTHMESYIYEIIYPPEIKQIVDTPRPRPWLYEYAAPGIL